MERNRETGRGVVHIVVKRSLGMLVKVVSIREET